MAADLIPITLLPLGSTFEQQTPQVNEFAFDPNAIAYEPVPTVVIPQIPPTANPIVARGNDVNWGSWSKTTKLDAHAEPEWQGSDLVQSPFLDYERRFTLEGGVAITYKTVDDSLWRLLVRVALWLIFLGVVATYALRHSPYPALPPWCPLGGPCRGQLPLVPLLLNLVAFGGVGWLSFLILFPEDQCLREIEIRPDCLILDGTDLFWRQHFTIAWPSFGPDEDGMLVLRGTYGTRKVEFLSLKHFEENDHAPQVLATHIQAAFQQLWAQPGAR